ncbi:MAG: hypothetical protein HFG80_03290 [Eubacterium sp.]|nr:hypothetical protein [Eubacterium sp.]
MNIVHLSFSTIATLKFAVSANKRIAATVGTAAVNVTGVFTGAGTNAPVLPVL